MFIALEPADSLCYIRHIHMGGLAIRESRNAKVGLFACTLAVENLHESFFLFGKPVAACFKTLFLGLDGGYLGTDVQYELCEIFEDGSFHPFNEDGLAVFYKENIETEKIRNVMVAFGIPPTSEMNEDCLCRALAIQFRAFVESVTDEADDIVAMEYQKLLAEPHTEVTETYQPASVLYPGDQIYLKSKFRPTHQVNIYEVFLHTWEFENIGTQVWRGRRLYLSNHDVIRPRTDANYIDIPDTPPHKGVKITVSMDARSFEGKTECKWIMVDKDNNDCFPNSSTFTFVVSTKFEYQKTEVIQ